MKIVLYFQFFWCVNAFPSDRQQTDDQQCESIACTSSIESPFLLQRSNALTSINEGRVVHKRGNGEVYTKEQVGQCFVEETARLRRQELTESVFGVLGGSADLGSGFKKFGKRGKKSELIQTNRSKTRFVGAVIMGVAAIGGAVASGAHAIENADADNCMEKGFEAVLDGIEKVQTTATKTLEAVGRLESSMAENHKSVLAGQTALQTSFKEGVAQLQGNQAEMLHETKSFRAGVEDAIGRLDEELTRTVRNQNTLSVQLDQLSLQIHASEQRLLAEEYSAKAVSVISAAKRITGAVEDIQDMMGQVYDHRVGLASLQIGSDREDLVNTLRWGSTEKQQMIQLKDVVRQAWTRARDAFSVMAIGLSEGLFFRKYFLEGMRLAAEDFVSTHAAANSGTCGGIVSNVQPLLNHLSTEVLHDNDMLEVVLGSIVQTHDVFKTMTLVFGRHSVSPAQYKDSLVTLSHAFGAVADELSSSDQVLRLIQDLVSPVLTVHCPLSSGCRDAVFEANHIAATSQGVQITTGVIGFEPLSRIAHTSADAKFYDCAGRPSSIAAEITLNDVSKSQSQVLSPRAGAHYSQVACPSTKTYRLRCGQSVYNLRRYPTRDTNVEFSCTVTKNYRGPGGRYEEWDVAWVAKRAGTNTRETVSTSHFMCDLRDGEGSHTVAATPKSDAASNQLVDGNYAAWTMGGQPWTDASDTLLGALGAATEDSVMRLFLITNHQKCAESLPHGRVVTISNDQVTWSWDRASPYFCWDCVVDAHDQWLHEVIVPSYPDRSFTLIWKFSERLTLKERMVKAIQSGVAVVWEANWGDNYKTVSGTWRFSRTANKNDLDNHDGSLSGDDGGWGAGQYIDGEGLHTNGMEFGHINQNKNDHSTRSCDTLVVNSVSFPNQVFTSKMYVVY